MSHKTDKSDPLYCPPEILEKKSQDLNCALVAASAAVDGGIWKQASFEGGGLQDVKKEYYQRHISPSRGAGIVYTPPQYSDHVAVAVVLKDLMNAKVKLSKDTKTGRCQPWSRQRDVRSFFCAGDGGVADENDGVEVSSANDSKRGCSFVSSGHSRKRTKKGRRVDSVTSSKMLKKKKKSSGISSFFFKKS